MSTLYECEDCDPKKIVGERKDMLDHTIRTQHTNFNTLRLNIDGGEGQAPTVPSDAYASRIADAAPPSPEPTFASRLAPAALPSEPLKGFICPECGRPMFQSPLNPDYVRCEVHENWTKEHVLEALEQRGGKARNPYQPGTKEWANWRKTGRFTRSQWAGIAMMLAGAGFLIFIMYCWIWLHWRIL